MKIAVFSDTHGAPAGMIKAVRENAPDHVIHLGDGMRDAERLSREFPSLPVVSVPGNCDYESTEPEYKVISLGGIKMFLTHGHRYAVRCGKLDVLLYAAECSGASFAMFGHTHKAYFEQVEGIFVLNPGTAGQGTKRTWALLDIGKTGEIDCEIRDI